MNKISSEEKIESFLKKHAHRGLKETSENITKEGISHLPLIDASNISEEVKELLPHGNLVLPYRFDVTDKGVFCYRYNKKPLWLCTPLEVTAFTRDPNDPDWGCIVTFWDRDKHHREHFISMGLLTSSGEELCRELSRKGLQLETGLPESKYLVKYILNAQTKKRVHCVSRIGWHNQVFVLPNKTYGQSEETLLYKNDYAQHHYKQSGTLDEWKKHIASLCAGNTRLMFAVSLAFAGPLVGLLGLESGGFHLLGESSIGKSTLLTVAASIYGGENYVHNLRATDNALEGLAALHNNTLLVLDELSQLSPRIAAEVFYMLANGQSKARAHKTGQAKNRLLWLLLFLTSGELSLAAHMQSIGQTIKAGQEIRSVNIPADAGKGYGVFDTLHQHKDGASLSNYLKNQCRKYYGSPIDAFLTQLIGEDKTSIKEGWNSITRIFLQRIKGEDAHGQVKRVAERFALVAVAGKLATEWSITDWSSDACIEAVFTCFESWVNNHREGVTSSHEEEKILEQVRHFFESQPHRFDPFIVKSPPKVNRAGFIDETQNKDKSGDYYVFVNTFKNEICKGHEPAVVERLLLKRGLLKCNAAGKVGQPIWVPSQGRTMRLYNISSLIMGEKIENR